MTHSSGPGDMGQLPTSSDVAAPLIDVLGILRYLGHSQPSEKIWQHILESITFWSGFDAGLLFLRTEEGGFICRAVHGLKPRLVQGVKQLAKQPLSALGDVKRQDRWISNPAEQVGPFWRVLAPANIKCWLAKPFTVASGTEKGLPAGVWLLGSSSIQTFEGHFREQTLAVIDTFSNLVLNLEQLAAERTQFQEQKRLLEATATVLRFKHDLSLATRMLGQHLYFWFKADVAVFSFVLDQTKATKPQRVFVRQNPNTPPVSLTSFQIKDIGLFHQKLEKAPRPVRFSATDGQQQYSFCREGRHVLSAPIRDAGRFLGGLTLFRNGSQDAFAESEVVQVEALLAGLSEPFLLLIEEARRLATEELRRTLAQLARDLFKLTDLKSLQQFVCNRLHAALDVTVALSALNGTILAQHPKTPLRWDLPNVCLPVELHGETQAVLMLSARAENDQLPDLSLMEDFMAQLKLAWDQVCYLNSLVSEARTDRLTGLLHREDFISDLNQQVVRSRDEDRPFSLMVIHTDHLERINKKIGRQGGDAVLVAFAKLLKEQYPHHSLGRITNNGLAVLLPRVDLDEAMQHAEGFRSRLSEVRVRNWEVLTASIGISTFPFHALDAEEILFSGEQAAALAELQGHDQVAMIGSERVKNLVLKAFVTTLKNSQFETGPSLLRRLSGQMHAIHPATAKSSSIIEIVTSLAQALDAKDHYTGNHSAEASRIGQLLARHAGLTENDIELVRMGTLLHDIGKIGIPERILRSPAKLTEEEWEIMKQHPVIGEQILKPIPAMSEVARVVRHHHERWDGKGYPDRLKGDEIPLGSRFVSLVDTYHAIVSNRPYRPGASPKAAIDEIKRWAGTQYDPYLVEVFDQMLAARGYELSLEDA
ncbi:MAG: diguanylate cyclase [Blastocatellia bacterium]|nr:diguanylate cyclase [Blastocatellia bacterium]